MVKFEKLLEGELVREWRESYVNYRQLKQDLKNLREFSEKQVYVSVQHNQSISQEHVLSSFPSPLEEFMKIRHHRWSLWSQGGLNMVIHQRRSNACGEGGLFETELFGTGLTSEAQKLFFERLDTELNKVNKFYKGKEEELLSWAGQLEAQIDPQCDRRRGSSLKRADDLSSTDAGVVDCKAAPEKNILIGGKRVCTGFLSSRLSQSGKLLRGSFMELYKSLGLLKDYSSLNLTAFGKILKKHDKITGQKVSNVYLRAVECSYFASSDKLAKTMDKLESLFTEHFTKNNHREALAYLKPTLNSKSHKMIFLLGLFSGSSMVLIFVLIITMLNQGGLPAGVSYTQLDFRIFSTLALLSLHLYMYGFNVFIWQRVHINFAVILDFAPGKKLAVCDVLLLSTAFTTMMLSAMVVQLMFYSIAARASVLPLTITVVFLCLLLILPVDVCCRSIRYAFLRRLWQILLSPLYQVTFSDFFLADQLTSQITAFQNLGWILCFYICRQLTIKNTAACKDNMLSDNFVYFFSVLPYWWRLMQCLRTWLDEGDVSQIANGGKYLSALVAIVTRVTFKNNDSMKWLSVFVTSSAFATCYQLYWDIVVDWGLLQPKSVNPWLRDMLLLRKRYVYFISMGINVMLRLAWLFSVLHLQSKWINQDVIGFVLASLEVFRRGLWNFLRLESEHCKVLAKYGAIKATPLPCTDVPNDMP